VPNHLRNAPVKGMKEHGYHKGYQYPHTHPGAVVEAHYFPIGTPARNFYEPNDRGFEHEVRERMNKAKAIIRKAPISEL
jgi:putative ATPase